MIDLKELSERVLDQKIKRINWINSTEAGDSFIIDSVELYNGTVLMFSTEPVMAGRPRDGAVLTLGESL